MSVKIMSAVWDSSKAEGADMLVMLALADHANDDGVSWPGLDRLAERARIDIRRAQRVVNRLVESGELYVLRNRGRGHTNLYLVTLGHTEKSLMRVLAQRFDLPLAEAQRLTYDILAKRDEEKVAPVPPFTEEKVASVTEKVASGEEKVAPDAEKVTNSALKGGTGATLTVINHQLTVNEPSEEPRASAGVDVGVRAWESALADLRRQLPRDTYHAWVRDTWVTAVAGDAFTICAASDQAATLLRVRLTSLVEKTLSGIVGRPVTVTFTCAGPGP